MNADYLNLSRSQDLVDKKERILYYCLEILPGILSWGTLIVVFLLSWLSPALVAVFIVTFDIYWLLRISYLSCHQAVSFRQMRKNLKINWLEKLERLPDWQKIYHLIILPTYKEGEEIIKTTVQSLIQSDYPKENLIVVLAVEERAGIEFLELAKKIQIQGEFAKKFFHFLVTCHPKDIPGEIAGKGSNVAWAIKQVEEEVLDKSAILPQNIIVSNFDIDTRPYPQYFSCLAWHYLTTKEPLKASYQPVPVYNNNIWDAPAFSRVIATSGTFWQMMQQERPEQMVTYSAHSLPFQVCKEVGYPSNIVADDSHIFWKSYFFYDGNYKTIPLNYPVSMDAVMAESFWKTAINQYKQQRRWAWGCIEIPYIIYGFLKNKKIPLREKIRHILIVLDGFWSWAISTLLIFFLGWLPLVLGGEKFNLTLLSYNLPRLTGNIMTVAMIGMVVSAAISLLLLPPRPKNKNALKNVFMVLQWFLLPLTLILFGSFPALDAQTRLIIRKPLGFWVTEKTSPARHLRQNFLQRKF